MRRCIFLLSLFLFLLGTQAFAQEQAEYFPLDKGRIWGYDDGNVDQIMAFRQIESNTPIQLFVFEPYNFSQRIFFRDGTKVYEYKSGYKRLWYDFGAQPGDTWKMTWEPVSFPISGNGTDGPMYTGKKDPDATASTPAKPFEGGDINDDADMTLVANDEKVAVPYGEYENVYHFQIKRPGVADAGYVEEWFAFKIGCIQREWDSIAGPRQQKLVKMAVPEAVSPLRMDLALDKEIYTPGEDIQITVSVFNSSDEEVTLNFPTSLQVDYSIDASYTYSKFHMFTEAVTEVTIPARQAHTWTITHSGQEYAPSIGRHVIQATLIGPYLQVSQSFRVTSGLPALPEGVNLYAKTDKEQYTVGEPIQFTLSVINSNAAETTVNIAKVSPVIYALGQDLATPVSSETDTAVEEVKIPGNSSVQYTVEITADQAAIESGYYVLVAGLRGYEDTTYTKFVVIPELTLGTVTGTVFSLPEGDEQNVVYIANAQVMLSTCYLKNYESDMSIFPLYGRQNFSATTDGNGNFTLTDVPVGVFYTLTVQADGYVPTSETVRTLETETAIKVQLRPGQDVPEDNLNYRKHEIDGLTVVMGTDRSVYQPDSEFKAFFTIYNNRAETITFTFDSETFVDWYIDTPDGVVALTQDETTAKRSAQYLLELKPGESREFTRVSTFKGKVPENGSTYAIRAELRYTSCSIAELKIGDIGDYIKVLVVPNTSSCVDLTGYNNEMVVDCRKGQNAVINITTRNDDTKGVVAVSEILQNCHNNRTNQRFIRMIEVDADSSIRADMDSALVRIYYDPSEFGEGFDPESLVIAHWDDKVANPDWTDLPSRVDTLNNCVEAYTSSFSSFGLFQKDVPTSVQETLPTAFSLEQNTPNPFNPSTIIRFQVPASGQVRLSVYNVNGQKVAQLVNGYLTAGSHEVVFSGKELSSGVYFYRMEAKGFTQARKMMMIK